MTRKVNKKTKKTFDQLATQITAATGSSYSFSMGVLLLLIWIGCGPLFDFSETWQLFVNTGTTIITFLMVFVIQKAQNKEHLAIHLKLNELIASNAIASNRLVDMDDLTEHEMKNLRNFYSKLSNMSKQDGNLSESHSIEEALEFHEFKKIFSKAIK